MYVHLCTVYYAALKNGEVDLCIMARKDDHDVLLSKINKVKEQLL